MTAKRTPLAVFDFDGVIINTEKLRYLVAGPGKRDHEQFYARTLECPPNFEVVQAAKEQRDLGRTVAIVTGRMWKYSPVTLLALNRFGVPYTEARFRENEDYRKATVVKPELIEVLREDGYDPLWAWEDDPKNAAVLTRLGLDVTLVPGWTDQIVYPEVENG